MRPFELTMADNTFLQSCDSAVSETLRILRFHFYDNIALNVQYQRLYTVTDGLQRRAGAYPESEQLLESMAQTLENLFTVIQRNNTTEAERSSMPPVTNIDINKDNLQFFLQERLSVSEISKRLKVTRVTIYRKIKQFGLQSMVRYSSYNHLMTSRQQT